MRRVRPGLLRTGLAVLVLGFVVSRVGSAPFTAALDDVTAPALLLALCLTFATNAFSAARWVWTARRLGRELDLGTALPAYYRSVFLNQTLPAGVLGDVERAVRHGAVRPVVWERLIGQVVLLAASGLVLLAVPSPVPPAVAGLGLLAVAAVVGLAWHWVPPALRTLGLWRPLTCSAGAVVGHVALLLVALESVSPGVGLTTSLPLLLTVLVASSLPTSLAGWGPREGAAAGVFALAGLGAATGVTVAAAYGVLSLVAALPGGLLLIAESRRPRAVTT
jgi:uncharacterized membrane protein YbhN (UPF0104 family)